MGAWQDCDDDDSRSPRSSNFGSRERDQSGTQRPSVLSKVGKMQSDQDPMRLTVSGWGDVRWNPKTHPSMVVGMTTKRIDLKATTDIMNLRASDLPFSAR